ncbi:MAG: hypothetical protein ACRDUA_17775 [Micromonosporaceae bacterium]
MSEVVVNVAVGLVTSVVSGLAVWAWQRGRRSVVLRRKAAFFGLAPGGGCLVILSRRHDSPRAMSHGDVHAMIGVVTLAHDLGAEIAFEDAESFRGSNGDRTEFCIGGPVGGSNPRAGGHLAAHLPGVTVHPYARDDPGSVAFEIGGRRFPWRKGESEHALVARFTPPEASRPVFLIIGQTDLGNRAAVDFLKREYRELARRIASLDRFCLVVAVRAIATYGYQATELAADVTDAAFHAPAPAQPGPAQPGAARPGTDRPSAT